jgi:hypothetical protein
LCLIAGVVITLYFQYFAKSSFLDLHAGLVGLMANVTIVILLSTLLKQKSKEEIKSIEFSNL